MPYEGKAPEGTEENFLYHRLCPLVGIRDDVHRSLVPDRLLLAEGPAQHLPRLLRRKDRGLCFVAQDFGPLRC
jgi:hypothetical protein